MITTLPCRGGRLYAASMPSDAPLMFVPVGENAARPFGMDARDRVFRLASNAGFECADAPEPGRAVVLATMRYAWDPAWLKAMRSRSDMVLTFGGEPVMAHVGAEKDAAAAAQMFDSARVPEDFDALAAETAELNYAELRKRERPFVLPLDANDGL